MRSMTITGLAVAALLAGATALAAQTVPAPADAAPEASEAPATPAAPKPKPKRKGPPASITVINASGNALTNVIITAGDQTTNLARPLAPKGRANVKLPKMKGCTVDLAATFEGGGQSEASGFNVCKEKSIRFTG